MLWVCSRDRAAGGDGSQLPAVPLPDLRRQFSKRSGGVLNRIRLPSDIIAFLMFCRLRYRLTLSDLSEIMALCGIDSHLNRRGSN